MSSEDLKRMSLQTKQNRKKQIHTRRIIGSEKINLGKRVLRSNNARQQEIEYYNMPREITINLIS